MPFSDGSEAVIALEGTTQIDKPSLRRGGVWRAACSASGASEACNEPTCLCASPLRLRMKTSHSGVFGVAIMTSLEFLCGLHRRPLLPFPGVRLRRLAPPRALVMRLAPGRQPLAVARAVAG